MDGHVSILNYFVALQVIHKAGWVHRDLSIGNLYLYIDPVSGVKRGLIGDFEFAKKVGNGGRHEKRIVTLFQIIQKLLLIVFFVRAHLFSLLQKSSWGTIYIGHLLIPPQE